MLALVYDFERIVQGLRHIFEQGPHFSLCFEIELVIPEGKTATFHYCTFFHKFPYGGCGLFFACIQAKQNIVRVGVFLIHIMRVIGTDDFHFIFFSPTEQHLVNAILLGHLVPLNFNVIVFTKYIEPPFKFFSRRSLILLQNRLRHHRSDAASGGNEPFIVL